MVRSIHSATMIGGLGCTAAERRAATAADARSIAWKWQAAIHGGLPQLRPLGPRRDQHPPARARPHPRRARGPLHPRPRRQRHPRRPRHRLPHRHRRRPGLARGEADRVAAIADHTGDDAPALIAGILALDTVFAPALAARPDFRAGLARALARLLSPEPLVEAPVLPGVDLEHAPGRPLAAYQSAAPIFRSDLRSVGHRAEDLPLSPFSRSAKPLCRSPVLGLQASLGQNEQNVR